METDPARVGPAMYRRKCSYNLHGLSEHRCPECGRPFTPSNPRSYRRKPVHPARVWLKRGTVVLLTASLLYSGVIGWLWWGWKTEQDQIAAVRASRQYQQWTRPGIYFTVHSKPLDIPAVAWLFPKRLRFIVQRVSSVHSEIPITNEEFAAMVPFRHLQHIMVSGYTLDLNDGALELLSDKRKLQSLRVQGSSIRGPGLIHLSRLHDLERLHLKGSSPRQEFDGASLRHLAQLKKLSHLTLSNFDIRDHDLAPIAGLTELRYLQLEGLNITKASLAHLDRMDRLEMLWLRGGGYE